MAHLESYFIAPEDIHKNHVVFTGKECKHIHSVKRKHIDDIINGTDGQGNFFTLRLIDIKPKKTVAEIVKTQRLVGELPVSITVAQGLIRSQRMDWLIEKGTELGMRAFVPVLTEYCGHFSSAMKRQRWNRIAVAALKQCGRSVLPKIGNVCTFQSLPDVLPKPVFVAHCGAGSSVKNAIVKLTSKKLLSEVSLLIGPEGGFNEAEVKQFTNWGFVQVQLGNRRLRSETAAMALIVSVLEAINEI